MIWSGIVSCLNLNFLSIVLEKKNWKLSLWGFYIPICIPSVSVFDNIRFYFHIFDFRFQIQKWGSGGFVSEPFSKLFSSVATLESSVAVLGPAAADTVFSFLFFFFFFLRGTSEIVRSCWFARTFHFYKKHVRHTLKKKGFSMNNSRGRGLLPRSGYEHMHGTSQNYFLLSVRS